MYDTHFGLTGRPFQLTPDPKFWFETATHRKAMAYLGYGLAQGEGFIVITGDIGAGKTTLMGHVIATLDPAQLNVVKIVSTAIEADDLLRIVATALGTDPAGLAKAQLLTVIERGLHAVARGGRRTLLVVDEAQALPIGALEELRMLSNFQAGGHALLQIVLLGQPEFRDRLHGSDGLEQLRQRIVAIHHLDPMGADEVADYIAHRLSVVGWQGTPDFAADAFDALHAGSDGVPRRLNLLAGRVMLHAALEETVLIDAATVATVLADLHHDLPTIVDAAPVAAEAEPIEAVAPEPEVEPTEAVSLEAEPESIQVEPESVAEDAPVEAVADTPPPARSAWFDIDPGPTFEAYREQRDAGADPDRLAALEARIEEQDAALRRVLTLLVDWVEADQGRAEIVGLASIRDAAAA